MATQRTDAQKAAARERRIQARLHTARFRAAAAKDDAFLEGLAAQEQAATKRILELVDEYLNKPGKVRVYDLGAWDCTSPKRITTRCVLGSKLDADGDDDDPEPHCIFCGEPDERL